MDRKQIAIEVWVLFRDVLVAVAPAIAGEVVRARQPKPPPADGSFAAYVAGRR